MNRIRIVAFVLGLAAAIVMLVILSRNPPPPDDRTGQADRDPGAAPSGSVAPGPERPAVEEAVLEADGPALVVAVRGSDGEPVAGAGVLLVRDGKPISRGKTGPDGHASLPAPGGEGEVVAFPGWAPPQRRPASLDEGRIEITIPTGRTIEGRVLVDGAPPASSLELRAWSRTRFEGFGVGGLALPGESGTYQLTARTGPDGAFAFRGLPREWAAFCVVPKEHVLVEPAGNGQSFSVVAPTAGLLVRLHRLAVLTARIVEADGSPAVGAQAALRWSRASRGAKADAEGRIRIVLSPGPYEDAWLVATDANGIASARWDLSPESIASGIDLGDLKIPARREAALLVLSRDGKPVAGARAVAEGGARARPVGPSGADGRLTVTLPAADPRVRVAAAGHGFARFVVPSGEGPHPVTLPGGNSFTLRLEERDGKPPTSPLWVRIEGEAPLFGWEDEGPDPLTIAAGQGPDMWGRGDDGETCRFLVRRGRLRLDGLTPGRPVKIEVTDPVSKAVLATESVSLGATDEREITIRLESIVRTLQGRVVDEDGDPVPRAIVLATMPEGGGLRATSDVDGRFRVPGLRVDRVDLRVERHGHAPFEQQGLALPDGGKTVEVTLPHGRTVRVLVVDTAGAPVEAAEVGATVEGLSEPFDGLDESPGTFVVKDLPPGRVTLFALVAGQRVEIAHDTAEAKARIVVPRTGSLAVRIRFALEGNIIHRLRLEPLGGGGVEVTEDVHIDLKTDRTIVLPAVLPGRYRVRLEVMKDDEESEVDVYVPVVDGPEVTIRSGVRTKAEMVR